MQPTIEELQKECRDCGLPLPLIEFYFSKSKGYFSRCKKCYAAYRKPSVEAYKRNNPEKIKASNRKQSIRRAEEKKEYAKQYHRANRDAAIKYRREWYHRQDRESQLAKRREWYQKNKDKHAADREKYFSENKERLRSARREWENERLSTDLDYKIRKNVSSRIRSALRGIAKKDDSVVALLGCSVDELRVHIESQFTEGMNWANWGTRGWHIDHKIPLSWFDLSNPNCRRIAFHYSNMQPLWAVDNLNKKNKFKH